VRLHVAVMNLARVKYVFENVVGFFERRFDVTALVRRAMDNIGAMYRIPGSEIDRTRSQIGEIVVDQRRPVAHRLLGRKDCGQFLVCDIDQRQRFFRRFLIDGGDRSYRLAHEAHFMGSKNVLVFDGITVAARRHVFSSDHRLYAGVFFGLFDIDAQNFPVRNGTAQNLRP